MFMFDLSGYDPDIYQPIYVEHQPQLIARSDEMIVLKFFIINNRIYCTEVPCQAVPLLYYTYEDKNTFQSVPLVSENIDGMDYLITRLAATDQTGKSLRYYADFSFPAAGYIQRYPTAGTIDLFTVLDFVSIELPPAKTVQPGGKVYKLYWGGGPNTVHTIVNGHSRIGPPTLDVATDGRVALLNAVDNHILIYDPGEETYSSFPLPFTVSAPDSADLAFDQQDQLVVCDFNGEKFRETNIEIPYCYRLLPDGTIGASTPVYVNSPMRLTKDLNVLDYYDYRLVTPFDSHGKSNSREDQRQRQAWEFPYGLVLAKDGLLDWRTARFADIEAGRAFEVHSDAVLGALRGFEKTPQGYLVLFDNAAEQIRAVWIDPDGKVLKDVTLPSGEYSNLSLNRDAVAPDGSLYLMSSTRNGIEIHYEAAPSP
jgi:hypothetical protein